MRIHKALLAMIASCIFAAPAALAEKIVVQDGDTTLVYEEMAFLVANWTTQMRDVAIADKGDRLELINLALVNKKLAAEAEKEADKMAESQPEIYWEYMSRVHAVKRDFLIRQIQDSIEYPDFTELAKEQYTVKKDKIALNPERRRSSHILFASPPGLDRKALTVEAQGILDELRNGADFVEMVKLHSDEPGAEAKKGLFDRWLIFGEADVSPPYTEGLFAIEKVGDYAELVNTQFGIHIIRLEGIQESSYKTFDEVKEQLIADYKNEYLKLALKDYIAQFQLSDNARVDGDAIEEILAPYKAQE